jgi:hypothetical protein
MTKRALLLLALISFFPCAARAGVKKVPIKVQPPLWSPRLQGVFPLFAPSDTLVRIVVRDERPEGAVLCVSRGSGNALDFFAAEDPGAIAKFVAWAAAETLPILGLKAGDGGVALEIVLREFRAEVYSFGWALGNYLGWGSVGTSLRTVDGQELFAATYSVALYYSLNGPSTKKLTGDSLAFLYERLAWEVTARALVSGLELKPDPAQVRKLLASPALKNDFARASAVFWAGFASEGEPAAIERLYQIFRTDESQRVYQEAAIALARAKAPGAAEEIEAVLTGRKKLAEWEPNDAEQAWYLLHALGILGVKDLASKVPRTDGLQAELRDVVRLDATGEPPAMSPAEKIAYDAARAQVK